MSVETGLIMASMVMVYILFWITNDHIDKESEETKELIREILSHLKP